MDNNRLLPNEASPREEFKIKGAAARRKARQTTNSTDDARPEPCTICLQPITERAVAVPCNHLTFDFICLASWLQEQPRCPLCKATITEVQYDWRGPYDFKSFRVPTPVKPSGPSSSPPSPPHNHARRTSLPRRPFPRRDHRRPPPLPAPDSDPALARRRAVYAHRQYSLRVGANRLSAYRDFTPADVATNPSLQSRARAFLRRELRVFRFLDEHDDDDDDDNDGGTTSRDGARLGPRPRTSGRREFVIEYVVALLRTHELKGADGRMEALVGEMVGEANARLLLHELEAWLRSPYEGLGAWDAHVQYREPFVGWVG